ncbi:O-antigen/teichoic acid export membrane protein [Clavibacter michiganensis]|uniref:polysaccharide transporter n=1 Tax=Clavibacter michiganensis TaxID=28447 RepID=UPI0019571118|nr:polysaccharide transporter [Clavibacter michiganensis]MBM7412945.1 O-antigen/teichoic acid export membrane protein [Clavibacter michiganensis]
MIRRIGLLLPTGAAGLTRVLQLVLLVVLTRLAEGSAQGALVTGFALLSSFAIITDSGAANFLLSLPRTRLTRSVHTRAVGFHAGLGSLGAAVAVLITVAAASSIPGEAVLLLVALGVSQVLDSLTRTIRAPLLVGRRDASYAFPDLALVVLKAVPLAIAVLVPEILVLLAFPIVSLVVTAGTWIAVRRDLATTSDEPVRVFPQILEFGLSGSLSALYSQAPLVLGTAILGVDAVTPLALAYRVVQPLEVLPATLSQQLIPRIRAAVRPARAYWWRFALGGLVLAGILALLRGPVEQVFGGDAFDQAIFLVVLLSVAPKFGNYALMAYAMGSGLVRVRLTATIVTGVVAVALTLVAALTAGPALLAGVTLAAELVLSAAIAALLIRHRHRTVRKEDA